MFEEHLTELAEFHRSTSLLMAAAQRDLKRKLKKLMRRLAVSPSLPSLTINCYSIVEDDIFREKGIIEEFEIAKVVTHLSLWRADFSRMPPSLLFCSNMTVLNLSGTSIRTLPESMPESMPKLTELYLADIQHAKHTAGTDHTADTDDDERMVLPNSFSAKGFSELRILDISSFVERDHDSLYVLPHISFFTWFGKCTKLRELYVEDYNPDFFTTSPEEFQHNSEFYKAIESLRELEVLSCLMTHMLDFPDDFRFSQTLRVFKHVDCDIDQVRKLSLIPSFELMVIRLADDDEEEARTIATENNFLLEEFSSVSFDHRALHERIKSH